MKIKSILKFSFTFIAGLAVGAFIMYLSSNYINRYIVFAYNGLGMDSIETDVNEAMLYFSYAAGMNPNNYISHLGIARCFEARKEYTSAIRTFEWTLMLLKKDLEKEEGERENRVLSVSTEGLLFEAELIEKKIKELKEKVEADKANCQCDNMEENPEYEENEQPEH